MKTRQFAEFGKSAFFRPWMPFLLKIVLTNYGAVVTIRDARWSGMNPTAVVDGAGSDAIPSL